MAKTSAYIGIGLMNPGEEDEYRDNWKYFKQFDHGINWYYLISVAGGRRRYCLGKPTDIKAREWIEYNLPLSRTIENYEEIVEAFKLMQGFSEFDKRSFFYDDFGRLVMAQNWFKQAYKKAPKATVAFRCGPSIWGIDKQDPKKWDKPNEIYRDYSNMVEACRGATELKDYLREFAEKHNDRDYYKLKINQNTDIDYIFGGAALLK